MEGLITFLFLIVVVSYVIRIVFKLFIRHKINKITQDFQGQFETEEDEEEDNNTQTRNVHIDPNIGEYTDYEEIE